MQAALLGGRAHRDPTARHRDRAALGEGGRRGRDVAAAGADAGAAAGRTSTARGGAGGAAGHRGVADGVDVRHDAADVARVDAVALAGFIERVVTAVKVLALVVAGEVVGLVGHFAVALEELQLLGAEALGERKERALVALSDGLGEPCR